MNISKEKFCLMCLMRGWIEVKTKRVMRSTSQNIFINIKPLRSLEEIRNDILKLEKESEGLLNEIIQK